MLFFSSLLIESASTQPSLRHTRANKCAAVGVSTWLPGCPIGVLIRLARMNTNVSRRSLNDRRSTPVEPYWGQTDRTSSKVACQRRLGVSRACFFFGAQKTKHRLKSCTDLCQTRTVCTAFTKKKKTPTCPHGVAPLRARCSYQIPKKLAMGVLCTEPLF